MKEFARYTASSGSFRYHYILKWELVKQYTQNNYSRIKLQASILVEGANNIYWSRGSAALHSNSFGLATSYPRGETVVYSTEINVSHNSQGKGSITISGSISTTFLMNGSCQGTIPLPNIDRTAPTVKLSLNEATENGASFKWEANTAVGSLQGRLNGGSWQNISGSPFKISNLQEDTEYTYQIRAQKTSNNVYGQSNVVTFKTLPGTFAEVSINGLPFKKSDVYMITSATTKKLTKDEYQIIVG